MESDLARARTHTLTSSPSGVVDRQRATSILAAGSGCNIGAMAHAETTFDDGSLHIDFERREATVNGRPVDLTSKQYDLLTELVRHRSEVLPYERVAEIGWEDPSPAFRVESKFACVRLHRKLGLDDDELWDGVIQHVPGVGYRYESGRFPR